MWGRRGGRRPSAAARADYFRQSARPARAEAVPSLHPRPQAVHDTTPRCASGGQAVVQSKTGDTFVSPVLGPSRFRDSRLAAEDYSFFAFLAFFFFAVFFLAFFFGAAFFLVAFRFLAGLRFAAFFLFGAAFLFAFLFAAFLFFGAAFFFAAFFLAAFFGAAFFALRFFAFFFGAAGAAGDAMVIMSAIIFSSPV